LRPYILIIISIALFALSYGLQQNLDFTDVKFNKIDAEHRIHSLLDEIENEVINKRVNWEQLPENFFESGVNFLKIRQTEIVDWKDHNYVPDRRMLGNPGEWTYFKNPGLDYLSRIYQDNTGAVIAVIVWLRKDYKVNNRYLQATLNKTLFRAEDIVITEPSSSVEQIFYQDKPLIGIGYAASISGLPEIPIILILILISIGLFLFGIFKNYKYLLKQYAYGKAVISIIFYLIILRATLFILRFPSDFFSASLTDASYFASSWFNPSMIDYLINYLMLLVIAYVLFSNYLRLPWLKRLSTAPINLRILVAAILYLLILFSALLVWVNYQTIYHNSSISLDITDSIKFESIRAVAFVCVVLTSVIFLLVTHVCYQSIRLLITPRIQWFTFLLSAGIFVLINLYSKQYFLAPLIITSLYLVIIGYFKLFKSTVTISFNSFLYFFTLSFFTSVIGTLAITYFEREEQSNMQRKFANEFLLEGDDLAEYLLDEARKNIATDLFIQSRLASPFLSKETIRQKIKQVYLSRYFDKYNIEVFVFNANGIPYDQRDVPVLPDLLASIELNTQRTNYGNLYFISDTSRDIFKRYFTLIPIERNNSSLGFIVIDLTLKRIIPDNVYPELLVDTRFLQPYRDFDFSYAIYDNGILQYNSGEFDYNNEEISELIQSASLEAKSYVVSDYLHSIISDEGSRLAVVSTKWNTVDKVVAGFSFLFLAHLAVMLLLILSIGLYSVSVGRSLNYSTRIQLYLYLAFFMPLLIMSITVLGLMSSSFRQEQNQEYIEKARQLSLRVQQLIEEYVSNEQEDLAQRILTLSTLANVEMNIYDVDGKLLISSQPQIFDSYIQSIYLNTIAKTEIIQKSRQSLVIEENIGGLRYYNAYAGMRASGSGQLVGVLSIPYYDSGFHIERARIKVLANIINVFTLLFFIFLLISFFASKWLTFPLRFITQKLKKTTLTEKNQPLVWDTQDEIGLMVNEYNRMLENLERSKKELERSQLEAAWREIAQQVAHEIKNPLTPMKLTLQHLQQMLSGAEIDKVKTEKSLRALLNEVDTLNGIASSFSAFARMPKPVQSRVDLIQTIKNVVELYNSQGYSEIKVRLIPEKAFISADEQLLSRIISNLVLNAVQSAKNEQLVQVEISLTMEENNYLFKIQDNGKGITEEMKSKIFLPHFTTKQSGSGIGLAVVKQGVEYFGGKIWFKSVVDKGTEFYILFPTA
jgi:two-component system, NtrC family, nitrogen regulation sensor histidine kinase NtrY